MQTEQKEGSQSALSLEYSVPSVLSFEWCQTRFVFLFQKQSYFTTAIDFHSER